MAVSFVQGAAANTANFGTSVIVSIGTTTSGNLLVTGTVSTGTVTGISDNKGNTWTQIYLDTSTTRLSLWYAKNITGGATHTVTVTGPGAGASLTGVVQEFSGCDLTTPLDQNTIATNTVTTALSSGASGTTTVNDEMVVGFMATTANTPSLGAGYSNLTMQSGTSVEAAMESKIVASTGTQTATFTASVAASGRVAVATFKQASGGGGAVYPAVRMMMGMGQ